MRNAWGVGVAMAGALAGANAAQAVFELQLDINSISVQAQDGSGNDVAFGGTSHTGQLSLSDDGSTALTDVLIDDVSQAFAGSLSDLVGVIELTNGAVTGGSFSVVADNGETYTADVVAGVGQVVETFPTSGVFNIDGLTFNGLFAALVGGTDFAGVDVTPWANIQPVEGSFFNFNFDPDAGGFADDAQMEMAMIVPLPTPGALAAAGLLGLAAVRRRRI